MVAVSDKDIANNTLRDWLEIQIAAIDGADWRRLDLDFAQYETPNHNLGVLINLGSSDVTQYGVTVHLGEVIYNDETVNLGSILQATELVHELRIVGTNQNDWVDLSNVSVGQNVQFYWSEGTDYFEGPAQGTQLFFDNYPQPLNLTLTDGIEFVSSEGSATFNNNINTVSGTPYDDQIIGDSNHQGFIQSAGSDTVTAGGGKDWFNIGSTTSSVTITDYEFGESIRLNNWVFGSLQLEDVNTVYDVVTGKTAVTINSDNDAGITYTPVYLTGEFEVSSFAEMPWGEYEIKLIDPNFSFQDWIISQYENDGDLQINPSDYGALQGDQGILVNSTASDITVAGTVIPAGKIIYNGETADISEIYNAVSNADDIRIRGTNGDDWVDLSKTLFDASEFEWSAGDDFYVPSEQGEGSFTPWNFDASDSLDGSQGLVVDNSTGSLVVISEYGTFRAENISKFYDTHLSDTILGSDVRESFKLGQGGTDVVTGDGGSDSFRVSSRGQNSNDFGDYSLTITDYEPFEEISLEDFGFDTTNWNSEFSIVFDSDSDETRISINTQNYEVKDLMKIKGEHFLDNSHLEDDGDLELYLVTAELLNGAVINGTSGNDWLYGYSGDDTINGLGGDDYVYGDAGDDTLHGGDGEDWLYGQLGDDILDGGDGFDRIDFRGSTASVVVDFDTGTATGVAIGTDQLVNIERAIGSNFNDRLNGSNTLGDAWESYTGGLGNDTINGAGGNDSVWYGRSNAAIHLDLSSGIVTGGSGTDQLLSIEAVIGSNYADTLLGSEDNDWIYPDALGDNGAGTNFKIGGADTIDGKGGIDTVKYTNTQDDDGFMPTGIVADLSQGTVIDPAGNTDQLSNIENISGSSYEDFITGDNEANHLEGRGGNDVLYGLGGDDTLDAGSGNDFVYGGDSNDTLDGGDGDDALNGGAGDDIINGGAGNDVINDGTGDDIVDAGEGVDTYYRDFDLTNPNENWIPHVDLENEGLFSPSFGDLTYRGDVLQNFENVELKGSLDTIITGSDTDNVLSSDKGNDTIHGGDGDDTLSGGAGNDTLNGGAGDDKLYGGDGDDYLHSGTGSVELYGGDGNDVLVNGRAGPKIFDGGAGVDTYTMDPYLFANLEDRFREIAPHQDPKDLRFSMDLNTGVSGMLGIFVSTQDQLKNIENIVVRGDIGSEIIGNEFNNLLAGDLGNDALVGGAGNDILSGGAGTNSLTGGLGDDTYKYNYSGSDTISDIGGSNDTLYVTSRDEDHVGYFGDSYVENGSLILISRQDSTKSLTVENAFTADGRIENITFHADSGRWDDIDYRISSLEDSFTGDKINYFGTRSDDTLVMNDGYNEAVLSAGNDNVTIGNGGGWVFGGEGNDIIRGGAGSDTIVYTKGDGNDIIIGFEDGVDELIYQGFTTEERAQFVSSTTAQGHTLITHTDGSTILKKSIVQDGIGGLNIEQLSKTGDVVTYGLIADASYDLGGDGIGALDFAINFDVTNFDWVDGSLTSDYNWSMVLPNETEASSGVVKGGFIGTTKFKDFSDPIAEFQMTVLETSEPVAISITGTSIDGGAAPDTIETFSYMSSTLTATVITRDGNSYGWGYDNGL